MIVIMMTTVMINDYGNDDDYDDADDDTAPSWPGCICYQTKAGRIQTMSVVDKMVRLLTKQIKQKPNKQNECWLLTKCDRLKTPRR